MVEKVSYAKLREVLSSLGYAPEAFGGHSVVFRNPNHRLRVFLPKLSDRQCVPPVEMLSARNSLMGNGVVQDEYEFDSLFLIRKGDRLIWTDPKTGKATKVTAAAGESDGLVVVKENGRLVPCPVDEVKRIKRAATAGRK
jgi:hypothetical protein